MITDLFSPGSLTSDRNRLELRMERATLAATRTFLRHVGNHALNHPAEFSAGYVQGEWARVTQALLAVQASALGLPRPDQHKPQVPLTDDRLRASSQRLTELPIAGQAYASARAVMSTEPTARAMRAAMSLDSGETQPVVIQDEPALTAGLGLGALGRSWAAMIGAAVRREATITFNTEVIKRVLHFGRGNQAASVVWVAHHDERTRPTHLAADGYAAKPGGLYQVGGEWLRFPGDPAATAAETINCRCVLSARYLSDLERRTSSLTL